MESTRLGVSGLQVSALCLGTMQFGWTTDEAASRNVLDAYRDAGGKSSTPRTCALWDQAEGNDGGVARRLLGVGSRAAVTAISSHAPPRSSVPWALGPTTQGSPRSTFCRRCKRR